MQHTNRIAAVIDRMREQGISQLLICDVLSIYYLTGTLIDPGERFFALYLQEGGKHRIFLNTLFTAPADMGIEKVWYNDTQRPMAIVAESINPASVLGVDDKLPARFLLPLLEGKAASGFTLASVCVDEGRMVKDAAEQQHMITASRINDLAMAEFKKLIIPGVTEKDMAEKMLRIYRNLGADDYAFAPIVAFGANAAEGHHEPDDTVLKEGDCILIDTGCRKNRYCSDMTRTFFYKEVSAEQRKVYETVQKANEAAIAAIKPGLELKQIDKTARDIITEAGYGPNFTHRLGHFIGLDVHESGDVSSASDVIARPGMIFSIEPGIYLEGNLGVRIEDLVLVTEQGCTLLNHYTKELEIID